MEDGKNLIDQELCAAAVAEIARLVGKGEAARPME